MPLFVKRPFKATCNVMTRPVTHRRHRLSCSKASASRTANEEEISVLLHAKHVKLTGEAFDEAPIYGLIGKGLPLDQNRPFTDRREIRNADIGPFRARAYVD